VRLVGNVLRRWTIVALMIVAWLPATFNAQESLRTDSAARPADTEIAAALTLLKADPNLAAEQTITMLRWKDSTTPTPKRSQSSWFTWIINFFRWVDRSARVLMWCVIAVLIGGLVYYLARVARGRQSAAREEAFAIPTHVRDLDIRPEALPADIGGAARALWDRGEHRLALALLYRGLLSRLAHVHRVPIRDASTEGDCLALAVQYVPQRLHRYAARLVQTWQRFVYGRLNVQSESVYQLCDEFGPVLDLAPDNDPAPPGVLR
jgi:Domain of unknown function (DUF4129)